MRWPLRRSPLRARNPERRERSYARNFAGDIPGYDHAEHVRSLPCVVASHTGSTLDCQGKVDAAHVVSRKMGGADGDWTALVPLCRWEHHRIFDQELANDPDRFKARYGVDLEAVAAQLVEEARKKECLTL